ncbi:hypothetical protein [Aquibacillus rhizosphaerae]|uniref:DUF4829 domain-containing protein n=1 Tax=Aquibacillus rhizosphaerae TaxID=3051431 RepID=A0ABT7L7C0_9BACI|nr:hypothetical protein [Aquibacillus sp. LR5S19]MDL4841723.1 hypothetical protein [Aquibacillus sp. LR5S19]
MIKKLLVIISLLIISLVLFACSEDATKEDDNESEQETSEEEQKENVTNSEADYIPEDEELLAVLEENAKYFQQGDNDLYLATLHSESIARENTTQLLESMAGFNFEIELLETEIIEKSPEEAKVRYVQKTLSEAPGYTNNQTTGIHTLRPEADGEWKIFVTGYDDIVTLDENGEALKVQTIDSVLESLEGTYAKDMRGINLNYDNPVMLVGFEEMEEYASLELFLPEESFTETYMHVEVLKNAKNILGMQDFLDNLKLSFEQSGFTGITINSFDVTEDEGMFEANINDSNPINMQAHYGRSFFKGDDLYIISYVVLGQVELDEETKDTWNEQLKSIE